MHKYTSIMKIIEILKEAIPQGTTPTGRDKLVGPGAQAKNIKKEVSANQAQNANQDSQTNVAPDELEPASAGSTKEPEASANDFADEIEDNTTRPTPKVNQVQDRANK